MPKYTVVAIAGLIVLLLGLIAFLGGIGQFQAEADFDDRINDDQIRFEQTEATGGYDVCAYNNQTSSLACPDNPYNGSTNWLIGGFLAVAVGGGAIYWDFELRE